MKLKRKAISSSSHYKYNITYKDNEYYNRACLVRLRENQSFSVQNQASKSIPSVNFCVCVCCMSSTTGKKKTRLLYNVVIRATQTSQ